MAATSHDYVPLVRVGDLVCVWHTMISKPEAVIYLGKIHNPSTVSGVLYRVLWRGRMHEFSSLYLSPGPKWNADNPFLYPHRIEG